MLLDNKQQQDDLIGSYRRFGADGVVYQVISNSDQGDDQLKIRVLETGEETFYPRTDITKDPIEH